MLTALPSLDEAEITLIGTGGGYGESIVVHLGNNEWAVIDSCIDPFTKESLPLKYLKDLGVDIKQSVKVVLCTHWHDDHLLGISQLFNEAESAEFCWAETTDKKKFLQLVELDYNKLPKGASNSSTLEFGACIEIARSRNTRLKLAKENTTIWANGTIGALRSEIISLSPSDKTILNFHAEISELITEYGPLNKKIVAPSANAKSIAIYLKLGAHRAILGADLEISTDPLEGWHNILDKCHVIDKKASLFKIPHHGSSNGYLEEVWTKLLESNPVANLTPWNRNTKLPKIVMLKKFCSHSDKVYMTKMMESSKPKKRDKKIEKTIKSLGYKISEVKFLHGIVRCRIKIADPEDSWKVELFENAVQVNVI